MLEQIAQDFFKRKRDRLQTRGRVLEEQGAYDKAEHVMTRALKCARKCSYEVIDKTLEIVSDLAWLNLVLERRDIAIRYFDEAISIAQANGLGQKDIEELISYFEEALDQSEICNAFVSDDHMKANQSKRVSKSA